MSEQRTVIFRDFARISSEETRTKMVRPANLSLPFAALPVVATAVAISQREALGWTPAPGVVSVFLLSPLCGAFCGHWELRELRRNSTANRFWPKTRAIVGATFSYLELSLLMAALLFAPHVNRRFALMVRNDISAFKSLRDLDSAAKRYEQLHRLEGFPSSLKALRGGRGFPFEEPQKIDPDVANGWKDGYRFTFIAGDRGDDGRISGYKIYADPIQQNKTGVRHFCLDQTGVIRYELESPASAASSALQ